MKEDLIFHLASEAKWKNNKKNGLYIPDTVEEKGGLQCFSGTQLQEAANRLYKGEKKLLLIVINTTLVDEKIDYRQDEESGKTFPFICGPLNIGAVVDKIKLRPEADGSFVISFTVN